MDMGTQFLPRIVSNFTLLVVIMTLPMISLGSLCKSWARKTHMTTATKVCVPHNIHFLANGNQPFNDALVMYSLVAPLGSDE